MNELQFLKQQKSWCLKWLDVPENELPGTLTHEKIFQILEDTEDQLLDFLALQVTENKYFLVYSE